jgi:hypothetical protein
MGSMTDELAFYYQQGKDILLLFTAFKPVLGNTQYTIQWVPRVKWLKCKHDSSATTTTVWSYTSTSAYISMMWRLGLLRHGLLRV